MATFRLDATGRPCRRTRQESRDGVVSITTKLIARRQLSSQWHHRRNSCASKQTGGPSSTGRLEQIGQMHAPDLLRRERRDRQKKSKNKQQKQAAKTSAAAVTRGTRVTRATLAARTAQVSRPAASGTPSPTKQCKREGRQQQIPSWWIPHKKTNVGCDVVSLSLSRKSSPTKRSEKKFGQ